MVAKGEARGRTSSLSWGTERFFRARTSTNERFLLILIVRMYAIVDIETTGGYAANNAITEVAIVLHDGNRELKRYETLVRPGMLIPRYVQALTGITDEMVADAPDFEIIAPVVYEWLKDAVFVAHNVNFDYSFLRHQLQACGFELNSKKLCTVRLSRKVFPEAQ